MVADDSSCMSSVKLGSKGAVNHAAVVALTSRGTDSPDQQQSGHEGVLVWFFNRSALAVIFCARVELGIGICSIVRIVQSKAKRHQLKFYSVPGQQESLSENEDL